MTTYDKILSAARDLFQRQGYASTTTRDIATAAGVNAALVNYHFRTKHDLFTTIMLDRVRSFFGGLLKVLNDTSTTLDEKLVAVADAYITLLSNEPDLPMFILSEVRSHPEMVTRQLVGAQQLKESVLFRQMREATSGSGGAAPDPVHFFLNLLSMTVFPFEARPIVQHVTGIDDAAFVALMEERRRLIPIWMKAMITSYGVKP